MGNLVTKIKETTGRQTNNIEEQPSTSFEISNSNSAVGVMNLGTGNVNFRDVNIIYEAPQPKQTGNARGIYFHLEDAIDTFKGRLSELKRIKAAFQESNKNRYKLLAICGYGGIGKSQLAKKFIQENKETFKNIIWINAERQDTMESNFKDLQNKLKNQNYDCFELQDVYKYLNNKECLFIFDNSEDFKNICPFLPQQSNNACILITSQQKRWNPYESILLDMLDYESAKSIFQTIFEIHKIIISDQQIEKLLCKCEYIPLVLQITAGLICQRVFDYEDNSEKYDIEKIIEEIDSNNKLVEQNFQDFSLDSYDKSSVLEAVTRSLNRVFGKNDEVSKLAESILGVSAYLDVDYIYKKDFIKLLKCDTELLRKSLGLLVRLSLFQIDIYEKIHVHRTVHECVRFHHKNLENNEHLLCALQLYLDTCYSPHSRVIFKYGEEYSHTIHSFYNKNRCGILHKNISLYATPKILENLLKHAELIRNPEFLCYVEFSDPDSIQILKECNVNFDVENEQGLTALYFACTYKSNLTRKKSAIDSLIKYGANINFPNSGGNTVLHNLCESGSKDINSEHNSVDKKLNELCAFLIIAYEADVKIKNNQDETANDIANRYGLHSTGKLLHLAINNDIRHALVKSGQYEILEALVEEDTFDVNKRDSQGCTILHIICDSGENVDSKTGRDIFNLVFKIIKSTKADFTIKNNNDETAEDICRKKGLGRISKVLNHVFSVKNFNETYNKVLNKFIKQKSIDFQDKDGNTLLHIICDLEENEYQRNFVRYVFNQVIERQPNLEIRNNKGDKAEDIARRRNCPLLVDLLKVKYEDTKYNSPDSLVTNVIRHHNVHLLKLFWLQPYFLFLYHHSSDCRRHTLFAYCRSKPNVISDEDIIDFVQFYESADGYNFAIDSARKAGRTKLVGKLRRKRELNEDST